MDKMENFPLEMKRFNRYYSPQSDSTEFCKWIRDNSDYCSDAFKMAVRGIIDKREDRGLMPVWVVKLSNHQVIWSGTTSITTALTLPKISLPIPSNTLLMNYSLILSANNTLINDKDIKIDDGVRYCAEVEGENKGQYLYYVTEGRQHGNMGSKNTITIRRYSLSTQSTEELYSLKEFFLIYVGFAVGRIWIDENRGERGNWMVLGVVRRKSTWIYALQVESIGDREPSYLCLEDLDVDSGKIDELDIHKLEHFLHYFCVVGTGRTSSDTDIPQTVWIGLLQVGKKDPEILHSINFQLEPEADINQVFTVHHSRTPVVIVLLKESNTRVRGYCLHRAKLLPLKVRGDIGEVGNGMGQVTFSRGIVYSEGRSGRGVVGLERMRIRIC